MLFESDAALYNILASSKPACDVKGNQLSSELRTRRVGGVPGGRNSPS